MSDVRSKEYLDSIQGKIMDMTYKEAANFLFGQLVKSENFKWKLVDEIDRVTWGLK